MIPTASSQADGIRAYVVQSLIEPARASGKRRLTLRAGDVHRDLGLVNAYAAVCSVLRGDKLRVEASIRLIEQKGRANGANAFFHFDVDPFCFEKPERLSVTTRTGAKAKSHTPRAVSPAVNFANALVLVSCTKSKLKHAAPARDLYCSPAFGMKKAIIEREGVPWVILSAEHGLVSPREVIGPYNKTLTNMGIEDRREWARRVLPCLLPLARKTGRIVALAGNRYTEYLRGPLLEAGIVFDEPMAGLRQGEQLAWLSVHL